jgi:hypothetical protein
VSHLSDAASMQYEPGHWGAAFAFAPGPRLTCPRNGGDVYGNSANYLIDEIRISGFPMADDQVRFEC